MFMHGSIMPASTCERNAGTVGLLSHAATEHVWMYSETFASGLEDIVTIIVKRKLLSCRPAALSQYVVSEVDPIVFEFLSGKVAPLVPVSLDLVVGGPLCFLETFFDVPAESYTCCGTCPWSECMKTLCEA